MADSPVFSVRLTDGREFGPARLDAILQWGREGRVPRDALLVPADGTPAQSVLAIPQLAAIVAAPPTIASEIRPVPARDDGISTVIPYRNPPALIAYYLGLFSLFPLLGFFLAVPAFILGIIGLRKRKRNPQLKGSVHAWIGVIMGGILMIVWGVCGMIMIIEAPFRNW